MKDVIDTVRVGVLGLLTVLMAGSGIGVTQQKGPVNVTQLFGTTQFEKTNASYFDWLTSGLSIAKQVGIAENRGGKYIVVHPNFFIAHDYFMAGWIGDGSRGEYLESRAANSDSVIIGHPIAVHCSLTPGRDFIFSDYETKIDRVLGNRSGKLAAGDVVLVLVPGGTLRVGRVNVYAAIPEFRLLKINSRYLIFLYALPKTPAFKAIGFGTFELKDGRVVPNRDSIDVKNKSESEFITDAIQQVSQAPKR